MIQLKLLYRFSDEQLDLLPSDMRDTLLQTTRLCYEVVGEVPYGIFGVVYTSLLAREAVVWFVPYPGIKPSWQERREAKAFDLETAIGFAPLADVHVDDVPAIKFARFFGLTKQYTDGDFHRYSKEKSMPTVEVRQIRFSEAAEHPDFETILQEYAAEASIEGLPDPQCQVAMYERMQDLNVIHVLAAFKQERLVGFVVIVAAVSPHYGVMLTTTESFFVRPDDRNCGAGLALLRAAEKLSVELGAEGLLISTPYGGKLAEVLPRTGYKETNRVFFRGLT